MTSSKPTRRERQELERARARERRARGVKCQPQPGCPKPGKKAYPDQGAAGIAALRVSTKTGLTLVPYPCDCGAYHLAGLDRWTLQQQARQRAKAAGKPTPPLR